MANFATLLQTIASNIYTNGNHEIDAADLKSVLNAMVEELGQAGYVFKGVAQTSTNPGTPDTNVFYLAGVGTFTNFGGTTVDKGHIGVFAYNGSWSYQVLTTGAWFESEVYPAEGALEVTFYDSDDSDGVTIKINADVSNLGNSKLEAISAWWAAQKERRVNEIGGFTIEKDYVRDSSPSTLGLFQYIKQGQVIDSITGATSLIFISNETPGQEVTVNAADLPYTAAKTFVSVKSPSGTLTNVKIHVEGEVAGGKLADSVITTDKIADKAVTKDKIADAVNADIDRAIAANSLYYNTQLGDVAAKVVNATGYTLFAGGSIKVHFEHKNTASAPTLNVNGTGAHRMTYNGSLVSDTNSWEDGETVEFFYDAYNVGLWHGHKASPLNVSVSQNTETGHIDIEVGRERTEIPSFGDNAKMRTQIEESYSKAIIKGAGGSFSICDDKIGVTQGKKYKISISGTIIPYSYAISYALRIALVKLDGTSGGVIYNLPSSETFENVTIDYVAPYSGFLNIDGQLDVTSFGEVVTEDITVRTFADSTIDNGKIVGTELLNSEIQYATQGYKEISLIGRGSAYAYLNHADLTVKQGRIYSMSTTAGSESVQEGGRTSAIILIRLNYIDGTRKTLYYIDHGGTFAPATINFAVEKPATLYIEGNLSATSVINIKLTDISDIVFLNNSVDIVTKAKTLNPTWENYGITYGGTLYTNPDVKHAIISLNKGDVIKVTSSNNLNWFYAPVCSYDGTNYNPRLIEKYDWNSYLYIAEFAGNYAITAKPNITVQCISSDVFGLIDESIRSKDKILDIRTTYLDSPNKATPIQIEWEQGQLEADGTLNNNNANRRRTKDFILIDNFVLFRVYSAVRYFINLYDENFIGLSRTEYAAGTNAAVVLNTLVWRFKQYKPKYAKVWVDSTDYSSVKISGDTMSAVLNNRRILNSKLVKCAAHQGIQMHIWGTSQDPTDLQERSSGANFLSSFWGAYLCGFDMNLVNHLYTSDGVPVCSHDTGAPLEDIDKVHLIDDNGNNVIIPELTWAQLQTHTFRGEIIPSLDSVLYLSKMLGMEVFLVNTNVLSGEETKLQTVLDLVSKYRMWDYVWFMCSGDTLTYVLNTYAKAKIAICQSDASSTDPDQISAAINAAENVITDDNQVMVWLNGGHTGSDIGDATMVANPRLKFGCYNVGGDNTTTYDLKLVELLPYLNVYSSHYSSYGASLRNIELGVANAYPTIIQWQNGNVI